jgi:phospholipid/cholesterol/gamma-HCH transport system permease protein
MTLPIDAVLPELLRALAARPSAVLVAPPGAGKSTHAPLALLEAPWAQGKKIVLLSPRRVAARAGSGMAAELGNMRSSEQIDALETMAVNPVQYLVVPRMIAGVVMVPVLALIFFLVGIGGAWAVGVWGLSLDPGIFADRIKTMLKPSDITQGLIKALVFGFAVTLIACRHGYFASGGAVGVGQATTKAVVWGVVGVFVLDYIITSMLTEI